MMLRGYTAPLSADGRAGIVPPPPWHYSGDFLIVEYRTEYKEFFIVVGCRYQGQPASRCVYIWVDKDFAMYRGWVQGFPKKLGSIHLTRAFPVGKATPKIEAERVLEQPARRMTGRSPER